MPYMRCSALKKSAGEHCHVWFVQLLADLRLDRHWDVPEDRTKELRALEEASSEGQQRDGPDLDVCSLSETLSRFVQHLQQRGSAQNEESAACSEGGLPESGTPAREEKLKASRVAISSVSKVLERKIERADRDGCRRN